MLYLINLNEQFKSAFLVSVLAVATNKFARDMISIKSVIAIGTWDHSVMQTRIILTMILDKNSTILICTKGMGPIFPHRKNIMAA